MLILFCMRGCGRIVRPAFPAPSDFRRRDVQVNLARNARRDREAVSAFEARIFSYSSSVSLRTCATCADVPSPLVGEGGFAKRRRVRGSLRGDRPLIRRGLRPRHLLPPGEEEENEGTLCSSISPAASSM